MTPIPLLVASPGIDRDAAERLRHALVSCHATPELTATLDALLLSRFVAVDPAAYDVLVRRAQDADRAGIARQA